MRVAAVQLNATADLAARSPGIPVVIKQDSSSVTSIPAGTPQVSMLLAPSGSEQDMLFQQELLILGVLPAGTPTL